MLKINGAFHSMLYLSFSIVPPFNAEVNGPHRSDNTVQAKL